VPQTIVQQGKSKKLKGKRKKLDFISFSGFFNWIVILAALQ
jgi:hypothetical protein